MPARPEGVPCWADMMVADLDAAEHFYGELLDWTFVDGGDALGNYTEARSDGAAVAALAPLLPGQEDWPTTWTLYFSSRDADATAERVRAGGGAVVMGPTSIFDIGRMCVARDPGGAVFGAWQAGRHPGFGKRGVPGAFAWAEVRTGEPEEADAFYPAVFPFTARPLPQAGGDVAGWEADGELVAARRRTTADRPAEPPAYVDVHFGVRDCDEAVAVVERLGGDVRAGPADSPFGRVAAVVDPWGSPFSVIDPARRAE
ncbi:VOC family protein [Streptomyces sp. GSL17-111]|uniref:VOC family protein n=1 Tax=Streptomyces sp. GSL17-111 TaxID=3121596 RepID=UPI0030F3B2EF